MKLFNEKLTSFLISQALIWVPLVAGHQSRRLGIVNERISKRLHATNFACITPVVYGLGTWLLDRSAAGWYWVPLVMTLLLTLTTGVATWVSFRFIAKRQTAGTFALMIPISNTGHTMAGFITLLLLADRGYAFNSLLMIPQIVFVVMVWLPLAMHWGHHGGQSSFARNFRKAIFSWQALQVVGLAVGMTLNYSRVPMPAACRVVMKTFVFAGTALVMFAMGLKLRLGRLGGFHHLLNWVYAAKFVLSPLLVVVLCYFFGLHGLAAGALFIAAAAPSGVNVVAFSTLYDLDVDLANAGYLWSTFIFMLVVLPLIIWVMQWPFFMP